MSQAENFKDLGLDTRLIKILDHQGIYKPTEIQEQAVPTAMVGHDLIASSKPVRANTGVFVACYAATDETETPD